MDWVQFARNDWEVYHDEKRIMAFVELNKITKEQAHQIIHEDGAVND